jgi:hypothetical protein
MRRNARRRTTSATVVIAVALLSLGLAACGSGDGDDSADGGGRRAGQGSDGDRSAARDTSSTEPPPPPPPPPPPAPSGDVTACYDLACEISVTEGMEIPADGATGITLVTFPQVNPENVQIVATGPGIQLGCAGTPGSACTLNGVAISVRDVRPGAAVVSFTP